MAKNLVEISNSGKRSIICHSLNFLSIHVLLGSFHSALEADIRNVNLQKISSPSHFSLKFLIKGNILKTVFYVKYSRKNVFSYSCNTNGFMKKCNYSHKDLKEEKFIACSTLMMTTDVVLITNTVLEVILLLLNNYSQFLQLQSTCILPFGV